MPQTEKNKQNENQIQDAQRLTEELAEKNSLLSLSRDMVQVRAKSDLAQLIKEKFNKLFYFSHCTICVLNKDKVTYRAFLLDPNSKTKNHSNYSEMISRSYSINNGIDNLVLASDVPLIFDFETLIREGTLPKQGQVMYESGIKQQVGVALVTEQLTFGFIVFYTDQANSFSEKNLAIVAATASLISPVVANIMATETIEKKVKEREVLLSISDEIASVKNREGLLSVINGRFKQLFYFTHSITLRYSEDLSYLYAFLLDPGSRSKSHPDYDKIVARLFPVEDGMNDELLKSKGPRIFDIEKEAGKQNAPEYIRMNFKTGMKELVSVILRSGDKKPIGTLTFYSDRKGSFDSTALRLIESVSYHLSTAMSNILYHEDIEARDQENQVLLEIGNEIVAIKEKEDLLHLISFSLKRYFTYDDSHIVLFNKSKKTYRTYLYHARPKNLINPLFQQMINEDIVESEEIIDFSHEPIILDVDYLVQANIDFGIKIHSMGVKEFIRVKLTDGDEVIGMFILLSDHKNTFDNYSVSLLQRISFQLSKALANLVARDEIKRRDKENALLLSVSHAISSIRDKHDLLNVINHKLKTVLHFSDISINIYNIPKGTYRTFLHDCPTLNVLEPFAAAVAGEHSINDGIHDLAIRSDEPVVLSYDRLSTLTGPHINFIVSAGIREVACIRLKNNNEIIGGMVLCSKSDNTFTNQDQSLIQRISHHFATSISNIIANEEILKQEKEKSVLLSLSKHMAQIRRKEDLLTVMGIQLKKLFSFKHSSIQIFTADKLNLYPFVIDELALGDLENGVTNYLNQQIPFDKVPTLILHSQHPVFFDLDEMSVNKRLPEMLKSHHENGIKQVVAVGLRNEKDVFGILSFNSETSHHFSSGHLEIIQGVANQVAIAVANIIANEHIELKERDNQILLSLSAEMAKIRERSDLVEVVKHKLKSIVSFSDIAITRYNPVGKTFRVFAYEVEDKRMTDPSFLPALISDYPISDGIHDVALNALGPVVISVKTAMKHPNKHNGTQFVFDSGIKKMLLIKLTSNKEVIGFLNILSEHDDAFEKINFNILKGISDQLSTAISNILSLEEIKRREEEKSLLLSFSSDISAVRDKDDLSQIVDKRLKEIIYYDDFIVSLVDGPGIFHQAFLHMFSPDTAVNPEFISSVMAPHPVNDGFFNKMGSTDYPLIFDVKRLVDISEVPDYIRFYHQNGIREIISISLKDGQRILGIFCILLKNPGTWDNSALRLIQGISYQLSAAVSNILANQKIEQQLIEISNFKEKLEEEVFYLQEEISSGFTYSDIIGNGPEMQRVFHMLGQVAPANSTVLLLGETGTGKELIARAIHTSSSRKDKLMVKVNCAALPPNLIESELFGHERGSFTGATERRIGKFELADKGTLFLDEIGEMPLDLQVKLLRALQEREIERVGGRTTIKVDVRIIAATNRNLQKEVDEGRFRSDLFYRLNVFPITLPPLRERKDDIALLSAHFIQKYSKSTGKKIGNVSAKAMQDLISYSWPGNVRELEHLIERSILTNAGPTIRDVHLPTVKREEQSQPFAEEFVKTFEENERDYIIGVLNKCNGKIFGAGGAAEILDLNVSTLNSKIKKLGIEKGRLFYEKEN